MSRIIPLLYVAILINVSGFARADTEAPLTDTTTENEAVSVTPKIRTVSKLPEKIYLKAHSFLKNSKAFHNFSLDDTKNFVNEIEDWTPKEELAKRFPYYLSGYDFDDRPVFFTEAGKYKWVDLLDTNTTELMSFIDRMIFKVGVNAIKSLAKADNDGKDIRQVVIILDFDGFEMKDLTKILTHPELIQYGIRQADKYLDLADATIGQIIIINANYATQLYIDIARPIVGELMERVVVIGVNKYKWKAELQRILPQDAIPPWYGGSKDFKPLAVYG